MTLRSLAGGLLRSVSPTAWSQRSYSQEGEDLIVGRLLGQARSGFYVDVGSHHPFRFSNTYLLYLKGWRGLCVDPLPGSSALFRRWRKHDIAIEMGVSGEPSTMDYFMFNEPALNSFDAALSRERDGHRDYRITGVKKVQTDTLATIIGRFMPGDVAKIDLMSIDVEGLDLQVLKSNDWARYRPSIIIAECLGSHIGDLELDPTAIFLAGQGYQAHAKTGQSVIFIETT